MGKKAEGEAKIFIETGLAMMTVLGVLLMGIVLLFKTPILLLCGATDRIFPLSGSYLGITAFGLPFFLFSSASSHLIRADGSPAFSMISTSLGAVLNIFLDWLFMIVFGWGIEGAALATIIGQFVSFVLCVFYFTRFRSFKISLKTSGIKIKYIGNIARLGASNFLNFIVMMTVNIVLNNMLKRYGALSVYGSEIPLAVSGIIAKLNTILSAFAVGIALGCQPILGFNMGAKNYGRIKETYKKALTVSLCISMLGFLVFQLFPRQVAGIFGIGSELYFEFAERYLRIFMMLVCVFGIQPLSVNYFTATGKARQGIILSISRQGFILLPLLVVLPMVFGINGILYAGPASDALACALSLFMVFRDFKKMPVISP
jgi:putative MATE family efflux protein